MNLDLPRIRARRKREGKERENSRADDAWTRRVGCEDSNFLCLSFAMASLVSETWFSVRETLSACFTLRLRQEEKIEGGEAKGGRQESSRSSLLFRCHVYEKERFTYSFEHLDFPSLCHSRKGMPPNKASPASSSIPFDHRWSSSCSPSHLETSRLVGTESS